MPTKTKTDVQATVLSSWPPIKGISQYTKHLVAALASHGAVRVLNFKSMYPKFLYPSGEVIDKHAHVPQLENVDVVTTITWYNPLTWLAAGFKASGPIIHAQWWTYVLAPMYVSVMLVGKLRRKKIVVTVHNVELHEKNRLIPLANKMVFKLANGFIVHTSTGKQLLGKKYRISADKIRVIPHGILIPGDGTIPSRTSARAKLKLGDGTKAILFFGAIRPYKGLLTLLEALTKLKSENYRLIIAGQPWKIPGQDRNDWQTFIDNHDLADKLSLHLDFIPDNEVAGYFVAADLVVLPYTFFNAQSGVGSVALPFGKPLLVSDLEGLEDIVASPESIFKAGDSDDLATKLQAILSDDKLRQKLANDSQTKAKEFGWDNIAKQTIDFYQSLEVKQ